MSDKYGRCHDCDAPQTEINMLSSHILELQADKGRLIDKVRELESQNEKMKCWHKMDYNDKESCKKIPQGIQLLTEKELIEQLVKIAEEPNSVSQGWYQIVMSEAKQFLKDSEVEK